MRSKRDFDSYDRSRCFVALSEGKKRREGGKKLKKIDQVDKALDRRINFGLN